MGSVLTALAALLIIGLGAGTSLASVTAETAEIALLSVAAVPLGAWINIRRRRKRGQVVTWRNAAAGAWLLSVVAPSVLALAFNLSAYSAGEMMGRQLVLGGITAWGVGLLIRAVRGSGDIDAAKRYPCPTCGEPIVVSAKLCRFCRHPVAAAQGAAA